MAYTSGECLDALAKWKAKHANQLHKSDDLLKTCAPHVDLPFQKKGMHSGQVLGVQKCVKFDGVCVHGRDDNTTNFPL